MATKKKAKAKRKATKASKTPRKKRGGSARSTATASLPSRAKKKPAKKPAKKKKRVAARRVRRDKPTKEERRAAHPVFRKPHTGGKESAKEIRDYFQAEDLSGLSAEELRERKLVFLRAYANRGIVRDGLIAASVSRRTVYRWEADDAAFAQGMEDALGMATDRLEAEARRRAEEGVDTPVIYRGIITDTYKTYSDGLMQTLLQGANPAKYKHRTEHSGSVARPTTLDKESKMEVIQTILGLVSSKPDPT